MLSNSTNEPYRPLPQPVELRPAETKQVAGGGPTLPLPPPCRALPWPSPW
jgi:hypothetical protein